MEKTRSPARVYEPGEFTRVLEKLVESRLGPYSMTGLELESLLGEIGEDRGYAKIYGVQLGDAGGKSVELCLPRRLAEKARELEHARVRVRGDLEANVWRGRLGFRLDVRELGPAVETAGEEGQEAEKALSSVLGGYRRFRRTVPAPREGAALTACVIHPVSGRVFDDFSGQLGDAPVEIYTLGASMGSGEELREAVGRAEGFDVVVLIRGGGAAAEFEPLNDVGLVEAWMDKSAYTISAVGHSGDATLLDAVADASCETPTAAGGYLRESLAAATSVRRAERGERERIRERTDLRESLTRASGQAEDLRAELDKQRGYVKLLGTAVVLLLMLLLLAFAL